MTAIRWILALALGGFLIFFGYMKFTGAHIFPFMEFKAGELGVPMQDQIYPTLNLAVGAFEILAGVLLILPFTRGFGANLAVLPFLGAVGFHLSPLLGISTPTGWVEPKPVDVIAAGGPFARSDFSTEMTSMLFMMAAAGLVVAIVNAMIQRR